MARFASTTTSRPGSPPLGLMSARSMYTRGCAAEEAEGRRMIPLRGLCAGRGVSCRIGRDVLGLEGKEEAEKAIGERQDEAPVVEGAVVSRVGRPTLP